MSLSKLLQPESIAVVGVSDRTGSFGMYAASNALKSANAERVYFVHPRRKDLFHKKCYSSLADLPEVVDCVAICTPAESVNAILSEAGELGVKAAVVFASGFSEEASQSGSEREEEIIATSAFYGIKMLGPNCAGIYNGEIGSITWGMRFVDQRRRRGGRIGMVAHSGAVLGTTINAGYLNVGCAISSGNGNAVTLEECAEYLVDHAGISVVSLYIEGIKDAEVFTRMLKKAAERRKPVVVLKGGKSKKGAASAASHTGNMAGSYRVYESVLRKFGAIVVDDFEQFSCMSYMLSILNGHYPAKPTFGVITVSGGESVVYADLADKYGIDLPDLSEKTGGQIGNSLPGFATAKNPLDATADLFGNTEKITGLVRAFEEDDGIGGIAVGTYIGLELQPTWRSFCEGVAKAKQEGCMKPIFVVPAKEGTRNEELRIILEDAGVPLLSAIQTSMKCLGELTMFLQYAPQERTLEILSSSTKTGVRVLSEFESTTIIQQIGVPTPLRTFVKKNAGLSAVLRNMQFPVAMKICSRNISHKSDVGGVRLGIRSTKEARGAYDAIMVDVLKKASSAAIEGITVQEMVPEGVEMIVGITDDADFGPMLLVGAGGRFVEVFEDVVLYPLPLNRFEAGGMLKALKSYPLLTGHRGARPCDIDALIDAMVRLSDHCWKRKSRIKEIEINPLIVFEKGKGLSAVDALVVEYVGEVAPVSKEMDLGEVL